MSLEGSLRRLRFFERGSSWVLALGVLPLPKGLVRTHCRLVSLMVLAMFLCVTGRAQSLESITLSPSSITGGASSSATVTVSKAAPSGGLTIKLSSSNSVATTPATVTVPSGSTSAVFTVTTGFVAKNTTATIKATLSSTTKSAILSIAAPYSVKSMTLKPTSVVGGATSTGTITLNQASNGTVVVYLSSDQPSVTVPGSVSFASGKSSATFVASTDEVSEQTTAKITATTPINSVTAMLTVNPPALTGLKLNPTTVSGGAASTGTVTIGTGAPSGGLNISLASNNSAASVPPTVTVPEGKTTATFSVSTTTVSAKATAKITAGLGNSSIGVTLTIDPTTIKSVTVAPSSVVGGTSATGTVTLNGDAGASGLTVSLSSSSTAASVPASVTIAGGSNSATFAISTTDLGVNASAKITAKLGQSTALATLTVKTTVTNGPGYLRAQAGSTNFTAVYHIVATYVQAASPGGGTNPPGLEIAGEERNTNLSICLIPTPLSGPGAYSTDWCNIQDSGTDGMIWVADGVTVTITSITSSGGTYGFGSVSGTFSGTLTTDDGSGTTESLSGSFSMAITNSSSNAGKAVNSRPVREIRPASHSRPPAALR